MKFINDVFWMNAERMFNIFHSNNLWNFMENILIFLCHEQHILAHGSQLPAHGSFYRVAHFKGFICLEFFQVLKKLGVEA